MSTDNKDFREEKVQIGSRLQEERARLGYKSQAAIGEVMGLVSKTQGQYERGDTVPDAAYLSRLAEMGADILYIITGKRVSGTLSEDEHTLLQSYRAMDEQGQKASICLITGYHTAGSEGSTSVHIAGDTAQVISGGQVNQTGASISTGGRRRR